MPTDQLSTTFAALSKHLGVHVVDWAERYRHTWEARLDRLDSYLQQIRPKERTRGRQPRRKSR